MHTSLKALENELAANLMAIPCPWGHNKGHLGLLQDPAIYLKQNGAPFNTPVNAPPAYPADLAGNAAAGIHEAARVDNQAQLKAGEIYIAEAINDIYYAALRRVEQCLHSAAHLARLQQLCTH